MTVILCLWHWPSARVRFNSAVVYMFEAIIPYYRTLFHANSVNCEGHLHIQRDVDRNGFISFKVNFMSRFLNKFIHKMTSSNAIK